MRTILFVAACLAAVGCADQEAEERARMYAAAFKAVGPLDSGDGASLQSARAEGSRLVLVFSGLDEPLLTSDMVRRDICADKNFRDVLAAGVDLRVDLNNSSGQPARQILVDDCNA